MTEETDNKSETLVVASKLKNYIREKSGMNTSAAVIDVLSTKLRRMCDEAVERAKQDGGIHGQCLLHHGAVFAILHRPRGLRKML